MKTCGKTLFWPCTGPVQDCSVETYNKVVSYIPTTYSQENNLMNDYSAKMAVGLFSKTWWGFSSYSIVYRGR